jgi:hypothetical protein
MRLTDLNTGEMTADDSFSFLSQRVGWWDLRSDLVLCCRLLAPVQCVWLCRHVRGALRVQPNERRPPRWALVTGPKSPKRWAEAAGVVEAAAARAVEPVAQQLPQRMRICCGWSAPMRTAMMTAEWALT